MQHSTSCWSKGQLTLFLASSCDSRLPSVGMSCATSSLRTRLASCLTVLDGQLSCAMTYMITVLVV